MTHLFAKDILQIRVYIAEHNGARFRNLAERQKRDYIDKMFEDGGHNNLCCKFCCARLDVGEQYTAEDLYEELEMMEGDGKKTLVAHLHHCHNTGEIVGYLCQKCNVNEAKSQQQFSVAFHNLPYDLLTLIHSFAETEFDGITYRGKEYDGITVKNGLDVIAQSTMKYSTIKIKREMDVKVGRNKLILPAVKFIDTFRFITSSLGKITDIRAGNDAFPNTLGYLVSRYGQKSAKALFPYSTQKGLIAYDAVNLENLRFKGNLPIEKYNNSLTMVTLTGTSRDEKYQAVEVKKREDLEKDYARTCEVYNILQKHFGDEMDYQKYFEFYLELDIFLMTDYFESLRTQLCKTHFIDPAYHHGLASYSQNAMLYHTKAKLHLIEPVDVSKLIVDNCRGGYSGIMKQISENFKGDKQKLTKYFDVNNLYGSSMIQKLANKYLGEINVETFEEESKAWTRDGDFAYFLLTDYKIPRKLHDKFAKFAPLISKKCVAAEEVSFDNRVLKEIRATEAGTKLCSTLENGDNYLMDYENYLFYKRMGYGVTVKRVFKFEQEYILKGYIDKNSLLRQQSIDGLFKQLYKDLNDICYGKSLQNPMKYSNIELLTSEITVKKRIRLKRLEIIVDDKLVLTDLYHDEMKFDTCIQYGFHILEKSKLLMYTALYEKIVPFCEKHKVDWELLMHDTDSFCFEFLLHQSPFKCEKDFILALHKEENTLFDLHLYSDPDIKDTKRKKVVGYFLDEYSDNYEVVGFVGLAAKSYCYVLKDVKTGKIELKIKGKGMRGEYLQALFDYEDFKKISQEGKIDDNKVQFRNIVKKNWGNTISTIDKVALSSYDDKWFIYKEDGETKYLPYGHYKIAALE